MAKRVGLSMRVVQAEGYDEPRDALAQEWFDFFDQNFPEVIPIPLPNFEERIKSYLDEMQIEALILTGGNDVGDSKKRDETEKNILDWAKEKDVPVLGVCRGLQFVFSLEGGELKALEGHVAQDHEVVHLTDQKRYKVNSFHNFGVPKENLPEKLESIAETESWVEAAVCKERNFLGLMWHPERPHSDLDFTKSLIQEWLKL